MRKCIPSSLSILIAVFLLGCCVAHASDEPKTKAEIISGEYLGGGAYGDAFKIDNRVYKWPRKPSSNLASSPIRAKRLWNEFYNKAYGGVHSQYATAKIIKLEDGKTLLSTPFINGGDPSKDEFLANRDKLISELEGLDRTMQDLFPPNVRIIDGDMVPIDFDNVITIAEDVSEASESVRL